MKLAESGEPRSPDPCLSTGIVEAIVTKVLGSAGCCIMRRNRGNKTHLMDPSPIHAET